MTLSRYPVFIGSIACAFLGFFVFLATPLLPWVSHPVAGTPLRILDRSGNLLYEDSADSAGARTEIKLRDVSDDVIHAVIAAEDRTFYAHPGLSLTGILRAAWLNVTSGGIRAGGSTITQQMVRSSRGRDRRSIPGKLIEMAYALKVDARLGKDEILEKYLNTAYFGHRAYGIAAAARVVFGKAPAELSLAESAFLAGLPQAPSRFDPFANFTDAKARQERVLQSMVDAGYVTAEQAQEAAGEHLTLAPDQVRILAPHFVHWVLQTRSDLLPESGDVSTTLDLDLQREAQRAVDVQMEKLKDNNVTSAAVVVLDAKTGDVLTMVGSADYFDDDHDGKVNVAVSARQPGSALKPFTYALALTQGHTAASTVADVSAQFFTQEGNPYTPRNYDFEEHGLVRYRESLANSYNIAAVKVLERVGVGNLLNFLRAAGISTLIQPPEHYGLALTLGSGEVRLLELASAYGIFPRGGVTLNPRALPTERIAPGRNILDARVAWIITDILSDNAARMQQFGEGGPLEFMQPVAAKTGTTRNSRDNWVVGYTPSVIVGVWVGNADNSPMKGTSGVTGAGPIFHDVMEAVLARGSAGPFERPAGITETDVCALSGKLPTAACPRTVGEWFISGTQPTESDDLYVTVRVDRRNDLRATSECPASFVTEKTFANLPPDLKEWALRTGWPLPPDRASPLCSGADDVVDATWLTIVHPDDGTGIRLDPIIPNASEVLHLRATASDGVRSVEWFIDDVRIGAGTAPDFRLPWHPVPGRHRIEARAGALRDSVSIDVTE